MEKGKMALKKSEPVAARHTKRKSISDADGILVITPLLCTTLAYAFLTSCQWEGKRRETKTKIKTTPLNF